MARALIRRTQPLQANVMHEVLSNPREMRDDIFQRGLRGASHITKRVLSTCAKEQSSDCSFAFSL